MITKIHKDDHIGGVSDSVEEYLNLFICQHSQET